jgi:hypothetical protein
MKLKDIFQKNSSGLAIPMTEKGVRNPVSEDVHIKDESLSFQCPTCMSTLSVGLMNIDPIIGVFVDCSVCKNTSHVPGGFRTQSNQSGLSITGGALVPIGEFTEWFSAHPVVVSLKKNGKRDLLYDYGLWAFCPKCGYRYSPTVLAYSFPFMKLSQSTAGFVLNTSSSGSGKEANSLLAGHCPRCSHKTLNAIIEEIPENVRAVIAENRHQ